MNRTVYLMLQESGRHTEALDAITSYLDLGVFSEWDEEKKLDFLTRELKGKRPLVPPYIQVSCCMCKQSFSILVMIGLLHGNKKY